MNYREKSIEAGTTRVVALSEGRGVLLRFECRTREGAWRTILASAAEARESPWRRESILAGEDPRLRWKEAGEMRQAEAFLDRAEASGAGLLLSGQAGPHRVDEQISLAREGHARVYVTDRLGAPEKQIPLSELMTHLYFVPDGRALGWACPLDFAWLPSLHADALHVCADHYFRSPAAIVLSQGAYAALLPDLDLLPRGRHLWMGLDLRVPGERVEAPRLSYGICPSAPDGHVYFRHDPDHAEPAGGPEARYGFDLLFGQTDGPEEMMRRVAGHLWERYGRRYLGDIRPQVLPFEEYGRRYSYKHELWRWLREARVNGRECAGLSDGHRGGAQLTAWENAVNVGYGVRHYADKGQDERLRRAADGMLQLSLAAPRKEGAFPGIYDFGEERWYGSLFWTARAADADHGYDAAGMGVTAWWQLLLYEQIEQNSELLASAAGYARFLERAQLPSGAIPAFFLADLRPARALLENATTAISGAVLAKAALHTGEAGLKRAALAAGRFVDEKIVPGLAFQDFETFWSCSPKPLYWMDNWAGILPHNNLSLQWACDQFLALFRLTGDRHWLTRGQYLVDVLSLYQQVWPGPYPAAYLFGGFGVMNTDGEWNDGRQSRFVPTYADYYQATGEAEYLERAVAACRASFALMDMEENHANGINQAVYADGPGLGYAAENCYHAGPSGGGHWTGFNWSSGGGLAASAYLERRFGGVWVDGARRQAIPLDGARASIDSWDGSRVALRVTSALTELKHAYRETRQVIVKFGALSEPAYHVSMNGSETRRYTREELQAGVPVRV